MELVISFSILGFRLARYTGGREGREGTKTNPIKSASSKLSTYKRLLIEYFPLPPEFEILLYVEAKSVTNIKKKYFPYIN